MSVLLVSVEPHSAKGLVPVLLRLGAKTVHACAWVLPWPSTAERLRDYLRQFLKYQ